VSSRHLASLALAAALLSACAPHPAIVMPEPRPGPVFLEPRDVSAIAALLRMEDSRTLDAALVQRLLQDDLPEVRGRAALAAGRVRDRRATPLLLHALHDTDATVRARAALGLGLLADSADAVIAALSDVALRDAAAAPAAEAVAVLGRLGLEQGRSAIDSLLARDRTPVAVRQEALLAAWRLRRAQATAALVQRWLADPEPELRWRAAYALMRTAGPTAVPALIDALHDPDDRVRASAARGLRAAVADSAGLRQRALDAAYAAADDPHPHVRINALRVLPSYRDPVRTTPVLLARLREEDANVAIAAAQALAEAADPAAVGVLRAVVADGARPDGLRTAALAAWTRIQPESAMPTAMEWADSSRWILRYHAARTLAAAPWTTAAAPLQRLARDSHPLVAAEALGAARTAADSLAPPRHMFIESLGAQHPLVRAAAVRGLARDAAGPADLDLLLQTWDRARHDEMREAAMATIEALGSLARRGVPVQHSFFLRFGRHGAPADPAVHRAILTHIGAAPAEWGEPPSGPTPRPLEFYEDIAQRLVAPALADEELPAVIISTPHGDIVLELAAADAPLTVHNFLTLVDAGYYAGTRWHRVVPNFVIQDGDPRGDGSGGPGHAIRDEINRLRYLRGALGMALSGPDTGGSQFFITHSPQPHLDGGYTIFGRVLSGMEAVDRVVQEEPVLGFRRLR
jgi:cyclophilin family peptidyl-prolyl cis-trans isomerase/HEAT repeat protein